MKTPIRTPGAVLLVQPAALGDVLLTSALLDDLSREAPGARVDFLTGRAAAPLLAGHPFVANVLEFRKQFWADLATVRAGHYDWLIDPSTTPRTAVLAALSGIPLRVGYAVRPPRSYAYTRRVQRDPTPPLYSALDRKRLLATAGLATQPSAPRIFLTDAERTAGRTACDALVAPADRGKPIVGITMSAGLKRNWWPPERWAAVARSVRDASGVPLVFLGPDDDVKLAAFRAAGGDAIVASPRPLREFLAMLPSCTVFVSPDTGPAHMAQALGVPTVTFYVRGRSAVWNPGTPGAIALEAPHAFVCPECGLPAREARRVVHTCVLAISAADVGAAIATQFAARA